MLFLLQVDVVYLEQDDGEEPAVFPQNGGQFEGLTPGKRYQLCGDATNSSSSAPSVFTHTSGHPVLGVAGEALVSRLCKSTAAIAQRHLQDGRGQPSSQLLHHWQVAGRRPHK